MNPLPLDLLRRATRIFLELGYPAGVESMPERVRPYWTMDGVLADYVLPSPQANGVCQNISEDRGYRFRLGCVDFRHLKLVVQRVELRGEPKWLVSVDTHDSWHHPDHPDAPLWIRIQQTNRVLKAQIEKAWEAADLLTQNRLLRLELEGTPSFSRLSSFGASLSAR
jgi:hypothetical protein